MIINNKTVSGALVYAKTKSAKLAKDVTNTYYTGDAVEEKEYKLLLLNYLINALKKYSCDTCIDDTDTKKIIVGLVKLIGKIPSINSNVFRTDEELFTTSAIIYGIGYKLNVKDSVDYMILYSVNVASPGFTETGIYALNAQVNRTQNGIYYWDGIDLIKNPVTTFFDDYGAGSIFKISSGDYADTVWFIPVSKDYQNIGNTIRFNFIRIKTEDINVALIDNWSMVGSQEETIAANIAESAMEIQLTTPRSIPEPYRMELIVVASREVTEEENALCQVELLYAPENTDETSIGYLILGEEDTANKNVKINWSAALSETYLQGLIDTKLL